MSTTRGAVSLGRAPALPATRFELSIPTDARRALALGWLRLGTFALAGSGLFACTLVLARTPGLDALLPLEGLFHVALVAHVDLSALVWFIAFAGTLWSLSGDARLPALGTAAFATGTLGTALMVIAPLVGDGAAIMSNYVPVIDGAAFLAALALIALSLLLLVARALLAAPPIAATADGGAATLRFGLLSAAVSAGIALLALLWSLLEVPGGLAPTRYFDALFWGPGHVLQFTWTQLLLVVWLWLASLVGARLPLGPRAASALLGLGLLAALLAPLIYLHWPVLSDEHRELFTWLMRFGGGLAIGPIGAAVAIGLALGERGGPAAWRPLRAALVASMALFALGGMIGFAIEGDDVRVPAHYHGAIVGVTLAMMGLAYALAPRLGGREVNHVLALWQVRLYAGGQALHVIGLLWSGGYGVRRKVAGSDQLLHGVEQVAGMALTGAGGLLAIVGGLLFVVIMAPALCGASRQDRRCV